jgi:hypothetical protein
MNGYATHELARIHQQELIAEADQHRLAKQARLRSAGTQAPALRPLTWLRKTAGSFEHRLVTLRSAHATVR